LRSACFTRAIGKGEMDSSPQNFRHLAQPGDITCY
jgi:hypothetical protein